MSRAACGGAGGGGAARRCLSPGDLQRGIDERIVHCRGAIGWFEGSDGQIVSLFFGTHGHIGHYPSAAYCLAAGRVPFGGRQADADVGCGQWEDALDGSLAVTLFADDGAAAMIALIASAGYVLTARATGGPVPAPLAETATGFSCSR